MEWTPETDAKLTELHKKRLGMPFISSWTHWPSSDIRLRLIELGLTPAVPERVLRVRTDRGKPGGTGSAAVPKSRSSKAGNTEISKESFLSVGALVHEAHAVSLDDDGDDGDLFEQHGCPRGYLMSEATIAALYQGLGRDYR
jgi:hypothetical protein